MRYLLLLLFFISSGFYQLQAQQAPIFDKNIALPEESGGFGFDIVQANGKLFVHAQSKVFVYNESGDNDLISIIDLYDNGNGSTLSNFGKYAPPYFNYGFHTPSRQAMVLNESMGVIYTITPDLNIISIETSGNYAVTTLIERQTTIIDHFRISSGRVIIKYDPLNERLYLLLSGRDDLVNTTGSFHITDSYFAVYDVNIDGSLDFICDELKRGFPEDQGGNGYLSTAIEIEFNHNIGSDRFYIARMKKLELWEFTGDPDNPITRIDYVNIQEARLGKMFTVKNEDPYLHKIIVLPYRLPGDGGGYEPDMSYKVDFYVIDVDSPTLIYDAIVAPSKRVLDAVFLANNNTLTLTYANDFLINDDDYLGTDVAFFKYNESQGFFEPRTELSLYTNNYPQYEYEEYNYPLKIIPGRNGDFYIGKVNEIVHVLYDPDHEPPNYNFAPTLDKKGAYFGNGIFTPNNTFFISGALNGFYNIEAVPEITKKQCGFPVYQSVYNPSNNNIYFYNTLNTHQSGIFVYNLDGDNGNGEIETFVEIDFPIGDIVYNPFQKHLLISSNADGGNIIKVLDANNNLLADDIIVGDVDHITQMFVTPNQQLCLLANTTSTNPSLVVYNATDYNPVDNNVIEEITKNFNCDLNANFCYNPYNGTTYATITNTPKLNNPYSSIKNTVNNGLNGGILLLVTETGGVTVLKTDLRYPRKVICPEIFNPPVDYQGILYINTNTTTNKNNISYFDCSDNSILPVTCDPPIYFNDIVYNKATNSILAFSDQTITTPAPFQYANDRIARFYRIEKLGEDLVTTEIGHYEGQISGFFSNPYNGMLYVHTKFDENKFGDAPAKLLQYDPLVINNTFLSVDLGVTSYYVEYDHFDDALYSFKNYNLTTPYINPSQNKIYLPNGAHSNVSVVNFDANEPLLLNHQNELSWLSFPRMNRDGNTAVEVDDVLLGNIEPNTYPYNYQDGSELENLNQGDGLLDWNTYQNASWSGFPGAELDYIQSSLGYKLTLNYDINNQPDNVWLNLQGTVLDVNHKTDLYSDFENWTGYWLYQEQDILDALADFEDDLYLIKHQNYCCVRTVEPPDGGTPQQQFPFLCNTISHNIKYGDMVVLKSYDDHTVENENQFYWNHSGNPPMEGIDEELEYYSYTETADYTPFVIELDSTENPVEMGAFVNDSCIGACTLTPEDTSVIIQGYLGDQPGDSVVFEEYFGTKSTNNKRISNYYVYNTERRIKERRVIRTGENKDIYFISFTASQEKTESGHGQFFSIFPNPVNNRLNINYTIGTTSKINIIVFDSFGRQVAIVFNSEQPAGSHGIQWNLRGNNGKKLPKGLYIIKLSINDNVISRKVVVN